MWESNTKWRGPASSCYSGDNRIDQRMLIYGMKQNVKRGVLNFIYLLDHLFTHNIFTAISISYVFTR